MNLFKAILLKHAYDIKNDKWSFLINMIVQLVNDGIMIYLWIIIFNNIETLKGYDKYYIILQYILVVGSIGLVSFFGEGSKNIALYIESGQLDYFLVRPKKTVAQMIFVETATNSISEIFFAIILFFAFFNPTLLDWGYFALGQVLASLILLNLYVFFGFLAFFIKRSSNISGQYFNFLITFSSFPSLAFNGLFLRIVLMTVIPAFFYNYFPAMAIINQEYKLFGWPFLFWIFTTGLVVLTYKIGIRRYVSRSVTPD
ncbi:MAG: ABC transporter permease [Bacteroidales bacterium]|jgi:ABC-2 type transport system permease protein|nr:ABC transporter permease [Bacteroidales bacterium]